MSAIRHSGTASRTIVWLLVVAAFALGTAYAAEPGAVADPVGPGDTPAEAPISAMLKRAGDGQLVLVAANRGAKPIDITFDVPSLKAGSVKVLFEERTVDAKSAALTDPFEPYAVHVYELSR